MMKTVRDIPLLENIPVLVRAAMNVPIENGEVANDYRLRRAAPTLQFLAERRARVESSVRHPLKNGRETTCRVCAQPAALHDGYSRYPGGILLVCSLHDFMNQKPKEGDRCTPADLH